MRKLHRPAAAALLSAALSSSLSAALVDLDFREGTHGEWITNKFLAQYGVQVSANNFVTNHPDKAIIFDTRKTNTADFDLEGWNKFTNSGRQWSAGNLKGKNDLGKILIIAENDIDANNDGFIDSPDDEGGRPAGEITFTFRTPITELGFNLIDQEAPSTYPANSAYVRFFKNNQQVGQVNFKQFVTAGDPLFDPTVIFANHSANEIKPIQASRFGVSSFDKAVFNFGWSDAIDRLQFTNEIPEPTAAAIFAGLAPLALRRKRR